jgi:hypothetical protein
VLPLAGCLRGGAPEPARGALGLRRFRLAAFLFRTVSLAGTQQPFRRYTQASVASVSRQMRLLPLATHSRLSRLRTYLGSARAHANPVSPPVMPPRPSLPPS